jgi:hypothetical protein
MKTTPRSVSVRSEAFLFNTPGHTARINTLKLVAFAAAVVEVVSYAH